jgi:hypothetical protein
MYGGGAVHSNHCCRRLVGACNWRPACTGQTHGCGGIPAGHATGTAASIWGWCTWLSQVLGPVACVPPAPHSSTCVLGHVSPPWWPVCWRGVHTRCMHVAVDELVCTWCLLLAAMGFCVGCFAVDQHDTVEAPEQLPACSAPGAPSCGWVLGVPRVRKDTHAYACTPLLAWVQLLAEHGCNPCNLKLGEGFWNWYRHMHRGYVTCPLMPSIW